jgi:hypothetical protein
MTKQRKEGWTSISLTLHTKKRLQEYGRMEESWNDLFERMMKELDEAKLMRERYRLK